MELLPQLQELIASFAKSKVTYALARLSVPDALLPVGVAKSSAQLAQELKVNEDALYRVMRAATQYGLLTEQAGDEEAAGKTPASGAALRGARRFVLTPLGECLKEDHPSKMKYLATTLGMNLHAASHNKIAESVQTGEPGCKFAHGGVDNLFQCFSKDPVEEEIFACAMSAMSNVQSGIVASSYDFSKCKTIVDVGGSKGTLVQHVLDANPGVPSGLNVDRPELIKTLPPVAQGSRLQHVSGNFFEPLPQAVHGADTWLLKFIMHDWSDELCVKILERCKAAMDPATGRILIIDQVLPDTLGAAPGSIPTFAHMLDLTMLAVTQGGRERTLQDWQLLAAAAGLELVPSTPGGSSLVWGSPPATFVVLKLKG